MTSSTITTALTGDRMVFDLWRVCCHYFAPGSFGARSRLGVRSSVGARLPTSTSSVDILEGTRMMQSGLALRIGYSDTFR